MKLKLSRRQKIFLISINLIFMVLISVISGIITYVLVPKDLKVEDNETTQNTTEDQETTTPFEDLPEEISFFVPRSEWTSEPLNENINLLIEFPIQKIIVGHTDDTESCLTKADCIAKVQEIHARNSQLLDIPWNFLIGGDGKVYEGRGNLYEGEHTMNAFGSNYNDIGIGIGFIGNFTTELPPYQMRNVFYEFIEQSTLYMNFSVDYKVFLQDQLIYKNTEASGLKSFLKLMLEEKFYEGKLISL